MASVEEANVIVVGAGAAGVGVGVALAQAGIEKVLLVDRHGIGASFKRWPAEMRFITPSFPSNSIGILDLNSIAIGTSPAHSLGREHPTGQEYARYLKAVAKHFRLATKVRLDVRAVEATSDGFSVCTSAGTLRTQFVVWAAGEFQYPHTAPFPGAELCRHSATIETWQDHPSNDAIIIGGYESGLDAAIHLGRLEKRVRVLARQATWESRASDPSVSLSTFTRERLEALGRVKAPVELIGDADIIGVERRGAGFRIAARDGRRWTTPAMPILATGFVGSHHLLHDLFEHRDDGYPLLNEKDESTISPGLFLVGPSVRHDNHVFCFIYKFRQRFAVVAKTIADRLGVPAEELENYRNWGMYLDDLSCCGAECVC